MSDKTQEQIVEVMARAMLAAHGNNTPLAFIAGGEDWRLFEPYARAALAALEEKGYAVVKEGRQAPFIAGSGIRHAQEPYTAEPTKEGS